MQHQPKPFADADNQFAAETDDHKRRTILYSTVVPGRIRDDHGRGSSQ